ncbi:hypothetical protein J7438_05170 [Thalassotalea sp. G20_0]|uniref:hypothetical protein n=1 Tax=Thalassotalea sp. G20_0 TaxID=2821093 RepID=UPI001ADD03D7|nr:hypothetical protein [Thalassotalea sp. G20_0]MBO9493478.1 hypothetical protein [Thalassotalea sp. G20_0]
MTPVESCQKALPAQPKQETKPITDDHQGKFNNLSTTIVSGASAAIPQADNSRSGSELLIKYSPSLVDSDTIIAATGSPSRVFRNMRKLGQSPNFFLPHTLEKYFPCADGALGQADLKVCDSTLKEVTGILVLDEFEAGEYHQRSRRVFRELYDPYSIHAGQLDDGMFFLYTLRPALCKQLFKFDPEHLKIRYTGYDDLRLDNNGFPFSFYCGKTFEEALSAFELACKGSDIATFIRPLLGFGSDSFSTIHEAHKPEVPELPAKAPERPPEDPEWLAIVEQTLSAYL